ncbi:hypothetical protein OF83DRAFT_1079958 [Amylostereum chailletii]|nr:hypothetical protein OF83DRAFT_1079958 [Amylostereum chailletii]
MLLADVMFKSLALVSLWLSADTVHCVAAPVPAFHILESHRLVERCPKYQCRNAVIPSSTENATQSDVTASASMNEEIGSAFDDFLRSTAELKSKMASSSMSAFATALVDAVIGNAVVSSMAIYLGSMMPSSGAQISNVTSAIADTLGEGPGTK